MANELVVDPNGPEFAWDFFLAHASADAQTAEQLYELLTHSAWQPARVFLDSRSVKLGDDWDVALAEAQRRSRVTVVLVSSHTQSAYYQREEVAAAIGMAREPSRRHRVVRLFIGDVDRQAPIPYGLRLKHGLKVADVGDMNAAAVSLLELLDDLQTIPDQILAARASTVQDDANGDVSLQVLAKSTSRGAAAIQAFTAAIEDMVRSGSRTLDFLADRRERSRLRELLGRLMDIEYSQAPLPWLLRGYQRHGNWGQVTFTIASLTREVAKVTELLAATDGPFIVTARDAYKSLIFTLRARSEVYAQIAALKRPSTPEDFAYLEQIAEEYESMISDLKQAQEGIARYLSE